MRPLCAAVLGLMVFATAGSARADDAVKLLGKWEVVSDKGPKIIVEKSTIPVKTAETIKMILAANARGHKFEVLSNPEFLAEGTAIADLQLPGDFADALKRARIVQGKSAYTGGGDGKIEVLIPIPRQRYPLDSDNAEMLLMVGDLQEKAGLGFEQPVVRIEQGGFISQLLVIVLSGEVASDDPAGLSFNHRDVRQVVRVEQDAVECQYPPDNLIFIVHPGY
jgi:hypothetical protein